MSRPIDALSASVVSTPSTSTHAIVREGWLLKKRRKKMQGFARRYFVLYQSGALSYSVGPGKPARDEIVLSRAAISSTPGRKDIHIDSNTATFHIKCLTMEDFQVWMTTFRRFIVAGTQRASSVRTPRLANWSLNKSAAVLEEMGLTLSELQDSILAMQNDAQSKKKRSSAKPKPEKDKTKDNKEHAHTTVFGLFKKAPLHESAPEESLGDSSSAQSQSSPQQRAQAALETLKSQHASLIKSFYTFSYADGTQPSTHASVLPATAEEEDEVPTVRLFSPITRRSIRSSTATSSDTLNEWFDALDGLGDVAQEFVLDPQSSPAEMEFGAEALDGSHSSLELPESGADSDVEEEEVAAMIKAQSAESSTQALQITRRTQLAAPQVGDEGSLFAILKKNIGKDLSTITFPVTFNEPLTLLQRLAEEMEYHDLLRQAADATSPVERMCHVAAFAVSQYAHTRYRTGRKGFNPMLGETFEEVRMRFIAEKVQHQPLAMAYHAEGDGWELYGTSSGRTKFWGKSLEIIPLGTTHLKIGKDHFEWRKPSSFVRNLMMGTKYLEHCGKMTIENTTNGGQCVLDFQQSGYWVASNVVSGTVYSASGDLVAELEGKWDDQIVQKLDSNNLRILWRATPFLKNASEYYGLTSFGITLNEITSDLVGVLPPTDSRFRTDVRALEEGDVDTAESEKNRIEEMQRDRRRRNAEVTPRWFKLVGGEWVYAGGYWERRASGWKGKKIDRLW